MLHYLLAISASLTDASFSAPHPRPRSQVSTLARLSTDIGLGFTVFDNQKRQNNNIFLLRPPDGICNHRLPKDAGVAQG